MTTIPPPNLASFFEGGRRGNVLWSGNVFKKNRDMNNDSRILVVTDTGMFLFKKSQLRRSIGMERVQSLVNTRERSEKLAVVQVKDQHSLVVELQSTKGLLDGIKRGYRSYYGREILEEHLHETETLEEKIKLKKMPGWVNNPEDGVVREGIAPAPLPPSPTHVTFNEKPLVEFDSGSHHHSHLPGPATPPLELVPGPSTPPLELDEPYNTGIFGTEIPEGSPVLTSRRNSPTSRGRGRGGTVSPYAGSVHESMGGYDTPMGRGRGRGRNVATPMVNPSAHAQNAHMLRQKGASLMSPKRPPAMSFEEGSMWPQHHHGAPMPPLQYNYDSHPVPRGYNTPQMYGVPAVYPTPGHSAPVGSMSGVVIV